MAEQSLIISKINQLISLSELGAIALKQAQCDDFMNLPADELRAKIDGLNIVIDQSFNLVQALSNLGMDISSEYASERWHSNRQE